MTLADQLRALAPLPAPVVAKLAGLSAQTIRAKRMRGLTLTKPQMAAVAVALRRLAQAAEEMAS